MKPSDLKGKKVVLTGTFVTMKRDAAEKLLTEAGATISGSISKKTDVLFLLVCHESARRAVAGRDLVDGALRERIPGTPAAASLTAALTQGEVLAAPEWHSDKTGEAARELGLPADAILLQGSGF